MKATENHNRYTILSRQASLQTPLLTSTLECTKLLQVARHIHDQLAPLPVDIFRSQVSRSSPVVQISKLRTIQDFYEIQ